MEDSSSISTKSSPSSTETSPDNSSDEEVFSYKDAIKQTAVDIEYKRTFIPKEELSEYWLRYPKTIEEKYRNHISNIIVRETGAKVYWLNGKEVKVVLYDD